MADEAALLVCDRGYLRHQKAWRRSVAEKAPCPVYQVESDVVVPVEVTSKKAEYAARTIRPRIHREWDRFLTEFESVQLEKPIQTPVEGLDLKDIDEVIQRLELGTEPSTVESHFTGGTREAKRRFSRFLEQKLLKYSDHRNQPQTDDVSGMSPYLHFGQVSPVYLAVEARRLLAVAPRDVETFLEELIVRRELAVNFVEYTPDYDSFESLPQWARATLERHRDDRRSHLYTTLELASARTHDPYWNAAMREMVHTGFMHNYMRMYWGKKILEWSQTPEQGYRTALSLNNKYLLDGRDANSYAGVGWVFGLHDRPWGERSIFGTVRYMAASGLERKCDIQGYVEKVLRLAGPG
jgi:deoxyribodipyrimidine photo-lyase